MSRHTRIWYAVYPTQCAEPAAPVALFEFQDMALCFAETNYKGKGWIVRAVTIGTGPQPLQDIIEGKT